MTEPRTLKPGREDCPHSHVNYIGAPFDGYEWKCDTNDCGKQVVYPYDSGGGRVSLRFPPKAYIRWDLGPDNKFTKTYTFKADADGRAVHLPKSEQVSIDQLVRSVTPLRQ